MPNHITISQKKISIGDKYSISVNGMPVLKASRRIFKIFPLIEVFRNDDTNVIFSVERKLSWFKPQYDFNLGGNVYHITTISFWKRHYQIHMGKDVFDIYGHRGRKVSVFLNDKQVAWFDSAAVTFFAGDEYNIHANSNVSVDWMIAIVLFWDSWFNSSGEKGAVNIKFGAILEKQPFDSTWIPV